METVIKFDKAEVKALAAATLAKGRADAQAQAAQEKREGSYAVSTRLAAKYGEQFEPAMEALFADIRTGTVKGFGAKPNDKGDGFKIPSGLSSAKSVLSSAIKLGVPLMAENEETGEMEARPFGQIRKDESAARLALKLAERTPEMEQRDALVDKLRAFADALAARDTDPAMGAWCDGVAEVLADLESDLAELMGDAADDEAAQAAGDVARAA